MNFRFLALVVGLAFAGVACSSVDNPPAPTSSSVGHPDEAAPVTGAAAFGTGGY